MKRILVSFFLSLVLATLAFSQTTNRDAKFTESKNGAEIEKVLANFTEAWNKHDAKAFSMVFAEDADLTNVVGPSAHGRAEVEKFFAPIFATTFKDTNLKITKTKIRFIKPDVAAVDAWWEMTGAKTREGKDIPLRKGLVNFVMTKEGGKWFITVMHNMDLPVL